MYHAGEKLKILAVDDTPENLDVIKGILQDNYLLYFAINGNLALKIANTQKPDLILLDIMMPEMDGYEVCKRLKANKATKDIPVIFLTAKTEVSDEVKGFEIGCVDYVTKPISPPILLARITTHLSLKEHQNNLEELVKKRTIQLEKTQEVAFKSMGTLAEYRDPETGGHIKRTQHYLKLLAKHLQDHPKYNHFLTDETIDLLYKSAPLHDIGKVGVKDSILLKPGKLTDEEFEEMKKHTIYGRDAIAEAEKELGDDNSFLHLAKDIAYSHQEKWDGSGYPQGLKGEAISIPGRLMAIVDVYDALISKRVYKPPFPHKKAIGIIKEGRGNHFDPDIVDAFLEIEEAFRKIALTYADFEEEREMLSLESS